MNMETPRTDKAIKESNGQWSYALADTCKQLERELAETRQQRDTLAEALKLLLSISYAILKNDKKTLSSIATITDKKSGEQTSVSVIDALESADAALAAVKGEKP